MTPNGRLGPRAWDYPQERRGRPGWATVLPWVVLLLAVTALVLRDGFASSALPSAGSTTILSSAPTAPSIQASGPDPTASSPATSAPRPVVAVLATMTPVATRPPRPTETPRPACDGSSAVCWFVPPTATPKPTTPQPAPTLPACLGMTREGWCELAPTSSALPTMSP
jgi:hypothetical protein